MKQDQHRQHIWLSKRNAKHPPPGTDPVPKGVSREPLVRDAPGSFVGAGSDMNGESPKETWARSEHQFRSTLGTGTPWLWAGRDPAKMLHVPAIPTSVTPCLDSRAHPSTGTSRTRVWIWRVNCWPVAFPGNTLPVVLTATRQDQKHCVTKSDSSSIGVTWAPKVIKAGWLRRWPLWKGYWILLLWVTNQNFAPGEEGGKFPVDGAGEGGCYCCNRPILPLLPPQQLLQGMAGMNYWSGEPRALPSGHLEGRRDDPPIFHKPWENEVGSPGTSRLSLPILIRTVSLPCILANWLRCFIVAFLVDTSACWRDGLSISPAPCPSFCLFILSVKTHTTGSIRWVLRKIINSVIWEPYQIDLGQKWTQLLKTC